MAGTADTAATPRPGNLWLDSILWGTHWSSGAGDAVLSVFIAGQAGSQAVADGQGGSVTALQPTAAETAAIAAVEAVTNLSFRTVPSQDEADLVWAVVGNADAQGGQALVNPPGSGTYGGEAQGLVALNRDAWLPIPAPDYLATGGYDHTTVLYALGQALGLAPPHQGGWTVFPGLDGGWSDYGDFDMNQGIFTMMSWNSGWRGGPDGPSPGFGWGYQAGPMALDIAALQHLYGADMAARTGDDTYRLPEANQVGTFWSCLWDAGGTDTVLGARALANVIDLRAATLLAEAGGGGFVSRAAGIHGGFTIANGVVIENATGGDLADGLSGNAAANALSGLGGDDRLDGGGGDDALMGGAGGDRLDGGAGHDRLDGGEDVDSLLGGAGDDLYLLTPGDTLWEGAGAGTDRVQAAFAYALGSHVEELVLVGSADLRGTGNALANRIVGNDGGNVLRGLDGDDRLEGGTGNDWLEGGAGADRLEGGAGNDVFLAVTGADTLIEAEGGGTDEVRTDLSHALAAQIEVLRLTGSLASSGTGNALANRLFGNGAANHLMGLEGADWLEGGAGADRLEGGADNDIYIVDSAGDTVVEAAGAGADEVRAAVTHALAPHVESLFLTGSLATDGTGNALANRIVGNAAANLLAGLDGSDRLEGWGGDDRLEGGEGHDVLRGGTGLDRLAGGPGNDTIQFGRLAEAGDLVLDFGAAAGDDDRFQIAVAGFGGGLTGGSLDPARFQSRADNQAQDADDRFVFRTTDATLWFDANGSGDGGLTLLADLQEGALVTAADILLVG